MPNESIKDSEIVQAYVGFEVGLGLGATPGGAVAAQLAINSGLIDKGTKTARIARSIGELIGGGAIVFAGGGGAIAGGGASATGVGSIAGVPVIIASGTLALGGAANVAAGARGLVDALMSKGYNADGKRIGRAGREPRETKTGANANDKKQIDDGARQSGIVDRQGFGDYIEDVERREW